jgi:D-alanyl-D-alanine carboxypeptidase/D-alanyl-D-alanine-endopeptidase (penicillin-binding protein 4)
MGGELGGQVRDGRVPAGLKPAFEFASPPLAEVVRDINKYSNNVMAQQLFLTLSLQQRGAAPSRASREVLRAWWRERIGGEPPVFDNGSGLSRDESITRGSSDSCCKPPGVAVDARLRGIAARARLDGTLRKRTRRTSASAHLKTGSLNDVSGVAGYVHGASGRRYVLVAIANHPTKAGAVRPAIQALVDWASQDN